MLLKRGIINFMVNLKHPLDSYLLQCIDVNQAVFPAEIQTRPLLKIRTFEVFIIHKVDGILFLIVHITRLNFLNPLLHGFHSPNHYTS